VGAVIMRFTDISVIDPIMSIGVAVFIFFNAINNLKEITNLFLEKSPDNVNVNEIKKHLCEIDGVLDVHHIHIRSIDGQNNYATMHIVTNSPQHEIKEKIRRELSEHRIGHSTLELETEDELCHEKDCHLDFNSNSGHHHHHHHH